MAAWVSRIYLRWYKAFNTDTGEKRDSDSRPWDMFGDEEFPFVEVPVSARVATVVGANETGKSQLLGAIQKVVNSKIDDGTPYSAHDICRYCGLISSQETLWPELGLEFSFETVGDLDKCLAGLKVSADTRNSDAKLRVFINGADEASYVRFFDAKGTAISPGPFSKADWEERKTYLPDVKFIQSDSSFENQVHISQLIAQYDRTSAKVYEPLSLQALGAEMTSVNVEDLLGELSSNSGDEPTPLTDQFSALAKKISACKFGKSDTELELLLFEKILKIPRQVLVKIRELKSSQNGYVEQLVEDINHRLSEALDISEFWQQDEDFNVVIEYKAGFFYFFITDRTGAKYTFDERSGGLKYFLSYYVQTKAIRDSMGPAGAIIVMDEPDGFLSAAGQRNLLSVFELLAQPDDRESAERRCQVIYTTHSPFLINRNFPDRISLVRKGDGGEGTQLVELVSTRQYEPVRSGLGIESAETLFMGSANVVLEGVSDQRVLVSAIQRFGDPARIDDMLDLNRVTLVSASGVGDIPRLLQATKQSKEKQPVVVVVVDGDKAGTEIVSEIVAEGFIPKELTATLSDFDLSTSEWCDAPETLEDLIPPRLLAHAIASFVKERWERDSLSVDNIVEEWDQTTESDRGKRLVEIIVKAGGGLAELVDPMELKSGVYVTFAKLLDSSQSVLDEEAEHLNKFETVAKEVCKAIRAMLVHARRESRQDRLDKGIRLEIERYKKIHKEQASKADVMRCLRRLEVLPIGADDKTLKTRENILKLQQLLDDEVPHAGFEVNAVDWMRRLTSLMECPSTPKEIE